MGKKITMFSTESSSIQERFEQYLSAASAKGLSSKTLKTYRQHFHCISKHLDITVPLSSLSRAQVDGTEKFCGYVTWNERLQEIHLRSNYHKDYEVVHYEDIASICVR